MKIILFFTFIIVSGSVSSGQNLIGFNNVEIRKFMKENKRDLNFDKVTNSKFIYLKYSDRSNSQTVLFFLNTDSVCRSVRIICDETTKNEKIKEFNSIYKISGNNRWIDRRNGMDYRIELRDEKWNSVVTMEPDI